MAGTANEYIQHHLQNLVFGQLPEGFERYDGTVLQEATWTFAHSTPEAMAMGFWSLNVDTLGWSIFLGIIFNFSPNNPLRFLVARKSFSVAKFT